LALESRVTLQVATYLATAALSDGAGRSNRAIGQELFISPATAARHVANILAKLGFSSRAQIAAWAAGEHLDLAGSRGRHRPHG